MQRRTFDYNVSKNSGQSDYLCTKFKRDEQNQENQPPQVHGGGHLESDAGKPDAALTVQQAPAQPEPGQLMEEAAEGALRGHLQD